MKHKEWILIVLLFLLVISFGCVGESKPTNETKLDVEQGVGVVGKLKFDELHPGLEGYISLDVRSNLEGEGAGNVLIAIDNVNPFKIVECGVVHNNANDNRKCSGQLDLDKGLPVREHKTRQLVPGNEINVFWRLKAPGKDEISNIALKHPLYYTVSYDYNVKFHQNIVFMSQNEMIKRRQAGEDYMISGESGNTAGELRFSGSTQQPIIYFFDYGPHEKEESTFSFATQYLVENKGKGFPISDVIVLLEYPKDGIALDDSTPEGTPNYQVYGWHKWDNWDGKILLDDGSSIDCRTGDENNPQINCKTWVEQTLGDDFKKIDTTHLIAKVIKRENFVDSFSIYAPFVMTGKERTHLRDSNIPMKIYPFNVYAMYRYFTIGKDYITVYPVRGI